MSCLPAKTWHKISYLPPNNANTYITLLAPIELNRTGPHPRNSHPAKSFTYIFFTYSRYSTYYTMMAPNAGTGNLMVKELISYVEMDLVKDAHLQPF